MIAVELTRAGKSSQTIPAIRDLDTLLSLIPEEPSIGRARRWIDNGTPDNTSSEYPTWLVRK